MYVCMYCVLSCMRLKRCKYEQRILHMYSYVCTCTCVHVHTCTRTSRMYAVGYTYSRLQTNRGLGNGFQRLLVPVYYWKTVEKQETDPRLFCKRKCNNIFNFPPKRTSRRQMYACIHMCTCIHVCIYTTTELLINSYRSVHLYICAHMCMNVYIYACMYTYMHIFTCTMTELLTNRQIYSYVNTICCVDKSSSTCINVCMCIYVYIYTYIHTYIWKCMFCFQKQNSIN